MYVGILTAPFGDAPLEHVFKFASQNGFGGIELACGYGHPHFDLRQPNTDLLKSMIDSYGVPLSAIACYCNNTDADPTRRAENNAAIKIAIDAAATLGVEIVCTLAGLPPAGKSRTQTIEEDCLQVFPPLLDYAGGKGVKIALENWFATNIMALDHWQRLFEVVPHENFGLNYDPSHLLWQGIDYVTAVSLFAPRIFHTHAKDTEIVDERLRFVGNHGSGWWRYVIPGFGRVQWGEYIAALRKIGYNGTLSIEHEDGAVGREEGFLIGRNYLKQFIA